MICHFSINDIFSIEPFTLTYFESLLYKTTYGESASKRSQQIQYHPERCGLDFHSELLETLTK
jgi:hypothetical protein